MFVKNLRATLILVMILTVLSTAAVAWPAEVSGHRESRYSPHGGCTELLVATIDQAQQNIWVMVYNFTSERLALALIRASKERGVKVRVVSDRVNLKGNGTVTPMLEAEGIEVKYDMVHRIMHNKVGVFDGQVLSTGSFNWSDAAENSNAENLHVIWDTAWAQDLLTQWNKLEAISLPRDQAELKVKAKRK